MDLAEFDRLPTVSVTRFRNSLCFSEKENKELEKDRTSFWLIFSACSAINELIQSSYKEKKKSVALCIANSPKVWPLGIYKTHDSVNKQQIL